MKRIEWIVLLPAQTILHDQLTESEEEQLLLTLYGRSRRSLIGSQLKIRKKESEQFWKTYQQFQEKKRCISHGTRESATTDNETNLTAKGSDEKCKERHSAKAHEKLYRRFHLKFNGLIGKKEAIKLMQLELQVDSSLASVNFQKGIKP